VGPGARPHGLAIGSGAIGADSGEVGRTHVRPADPRHLARRSAAAGPRGGGTARRARGDCEAAGRPACSLASLQGRRVRAVARGSGVGRRSHALFWNSLWAPGSEEVISPLRVALLSCSGRFFLCEAVAKRSEVL